MTDALIAALITLVVGVVAGLIIFRPRRTAPAMSYATTPRRCDYCTTEIAAAATRCPHCGGEFRYCPTDRRLVGLTSRQKFVGIVRGGTKTQYRCTSCDRVLDGPRF